MPFAVAAAIGSVAVAASGIAAVGLTLTTALEVVAAVGAITAVVGKFTGDKTLMEVGMAVGAVGGIGAIASGAGLLGDAANTDSLFGSSSAAASTAGSAASTASDAGATAATNALGQAAPATASALPDVTPVAAAAPDAAEGATQATGILNSGANVAGTSAAATPAASTASAASAGASATQDFSGTMDAVDVPNSVGITPEVGGTNIGGFVGENVTGAPATTGDKLWDFLQTNSGGKIAAAGMQSLTGFIQGAFSPITPAQAAALQAQAAVNRSQAQLLKTQQINLAQPLPIASNSGTMVTGKPAATPISGAPAGLINTPAGLVPGAQPGAVTGAVQ